MQNFLYKLVLEVLQNQDKNMSILSYSLKQWFLSKPLSLSLLHNTIPLGNQKKLIGHIKGSRQQFLYFICKLADFSLFNTLRVVNCCCLKLGYYFYHFLKFQGSFVFSQKTKLSITIKSSDFYFNSMFMVTCLLHVIKQKEKKNHIN